MEDEIGYAEKIEDKDELSMHLKNVKNAIYMLYTEIEWFRSKTNKERDAFRRNISPRDIGYITTLIRAIAKGEDALNDWVMNSNYNLELLKWQKQR